MFTKLLNSKNFYIKIESLTLYLIKVINRISWHNFKFVEDKIKYGLKKIKPNNNLIVIS